MAIKRWEQIALKEFLFSARTASFYFVLPLLEDSLKKLKELETEKVKFLFPVKSFNHPKILELVSSFTSGFDVSNANEMRDVLPFLKNHHIIWSSSPYSAIIKEAHFNEASCAEIDLSGYRSLRIKPEFLQPQNRFGISPDKAIPLLINSTHLSGLHCHLSGLQITKEDYFLMIDHVKDYLAPLKRSIAVNLGGGFTRLTFEEIKEVTQRASAELPEHTLYFEPGRWISKNAGLAIGKVLSLEEEKLTVSLSAICHLRWSDQLYSISFAGSGQKINPHKYEIFGPTCYENDKLGDVTTDLKIAPGQPFILDQVSGYSVAWNHEFNGVEKADLVFLGNS